MTYYLGRRVCRSGRCSTPSDAGPHPRPCTNSGLDRVGDTAPAEGMDRGSGRAPVWGTALEKVSDAASGEAPDTDLDTDSDTAPASDTAWGRDSSKPAGRFRYPGSTCRFDCPKPWRSARVPTTPLRTSSYCTSLRNGPSFHQCTTFSVKPYRPHQIGAATISAQTNTAHRPQRARY